MRRSTAADGADRTVTPASNDYFQHHGDRGVITMKFTYRTMSTALDFPLHLENVSILRAFDGATTVTAMAGRARR